MSALQKILAFAPDGKLERLCLAGSPNLLFEWEHEIDLGGKLFRPAGWDECFPTIDATADSPVMGDLIGLASALQWRADGVEQRWFGPRFEASRHFSLPSPTCLDLSFQVTNSHDRPFEFLWASHALIQCGDACDSASAKWYYHGRIPA